MPQLSWQKNRRRKYVNHEDLSPIKREQVED
jgi:hypothetical protein